MKKTKASNPFDKKIDVFEENEQARVERIKNEFIQGFEKLSKFKNAISIFGSSRLAPKDEYYKLAEKTSYCPKMAMRLLPAEAPGSWRPPTKAPSAPAVYRSA